MRRRPVTELIKSKESDAYLERPSYSMGWDWQQSWAVYHEAASSDDACLWLPVMRLRLLLLLLLLMLMWSCDIIDAVCNWSTTLFCTLSAALVASHVA